MGFDNECIVNIQSLAGEYFCPVCRTLVYPHEALQSQCTHLYCKPCLTFVVGTTKACPYDGYLVTEADSKPLTESNKALAEVIGKIPVHCLFHRSGCSWQGPLSDCTSHCSGCAFGNSPVVCNRCGIQIVHRQVQEHAQTCPGANPQAQQNAESAKDSATPGTVTAPNSSLTNPQPAQASQAQLSQTTAAPPPAQGSSQANANPQVQPIASAVGTAAEQWYPQQFQQYYQQYPGYDPYQQSYQQYYPYQQATQQVQQQAPQIPQPQIYTQHQTAVQPHPQPVAQVQGQTQAHPQPQMQPQPQAQAQAQPQPQQQQASQHQPQIAPQVQPQAHAFVAHNQVNPQQASHPAIQPHAQFQSHNQPATQVQNPQQQVYTQSQPQQFPHSMQQNFQAPQYQQTQSQGHQPHLQIQSQPQLQPHPHPQPPLQSHAQAQTQNHPHLHPFQPNNSQTQQPATHVVPGHQSHPLVQPQHQMLPAPPQHHPMHMHPSSGSLPPAAQFPQQSPHMRPPQANASMPNQQQPNMMQTQGQLQGVPPTHQQIPPQAHQGHLGYQRPVVQPMQQPVQQYGQQPYAMQASGPFQGPPQQHPFTQQPMHTHPRPQGPTQSLQHSAVALPTPPPHSGVQVPGVPPHQSQTYTGRPAAPNYAAPPQSFPQPGNAFGAAQNRSMQSGPVQPFVSQNFEGGINNQQQVPPRQQFSESAQEVKHTSGEGNAAGQDVDSASKRTAGKDVSSNTGGDSVGAKALESHTGEKSGDEEHRNAYEGENKGAHSGVLDKGADAKVKAETIGSSETSTKRTVRDEDANGNLDPSPAGNEAETRIGGEKDGILGAAKQAEYSSVNDSSGRTNENKSSQGQVAHQGSAVNEFGAFQDKGVINSSYPDQEKHQLPAGPYGSSTRQQRPDVVSNLQSGPFPGAPPNAALPGQGAAQLRPQGPGHVAPHPQSLYPSEHFQHSTYPNDIPFGAPAAPGLATSFSQGPQSGQQYQNNPPSQPVFSRTSNAEPIGGAAHGPDGGAVFQNQRVNPFEGRYPDHHVSGPFDRGQYGHPPANESRAPGFDNASGLQAKNGNDDHRNPFLVGPAGRFDQGEHQEAPRQFPKPSSMGVESSSKFGNGFSSRAGEYPSHDFNHDPSRFLPPYHPTGGFHPNDIERPTGFHEDHRARGDPARTQPEFLNSGPGFGMNRMPPRSPGREFLGIPSRGIGGPPGPPEGSRSFDISSDSVGKPFREHFRNGDMIGQDFIPNHVRRGELFGPRNVQSHMRGVDGFGTFPDPHMGDFAGPGGFPNTESFLGNKSNHPRLGEPGFRSSYSLHGFPSDGGFYAGNVDPFDTFRKRMPASMGWCRICKVDCDTVEGLDLHSQTPEHQQRTMDMVISIKQKNAKRQKTSKDHSSIEEGSRTRNAGNRGRGKKV